jgi:hypothetical protein
MKLKSHQVKLFLYVFIASFTALLADLQRHICQRNGELHFTWGQFLVLIINFTLQGLVAWRAYMDDSSDKEEKKE